MIVKKWYVKSKDGEVFLGNRLKAESKAIEFAKNMAEKNPGIVYEVLEVTHAFRGTVPHIEQIEIHMEDSNE